VSEKYPKDVRIVFKNFPLPMHPFAAKAAAAALAARSQGKFWEYHGKIFENFSSLSDTKLQAIAQELGLDMNKFAADQRSAHIQRIISRDVNEGNNAGVQGTPTIFVNGKALENLSLEGFAQMIEAEQKKKAK
jgi:protein-disulfide isomerase